MDNTIAPGPFDAAVSWLTFLHIADKQKLLNACARRLKPGAALYVEDFFAIEPPTAEEAIMLKRDVAAPPLPTREEYKAALAKAGFVRLEWTDMTAGWTKYVADRVAAYKLAEEKVKRVHGEDVYQSQLAFFDAIDKLFSGGRLGGCRYVAFKA